MAGAGESGLLSGGDRPGKQPCQPQWWWPGGKPKARGLVSQSALLPEMRKASVCGQAWRLPETSNVETESLMLQRSRLQTAITEGAG